MEVSPDSALMPVATPAGEPEVLGPASQHAAAVLRFGTVRAVLLVAALIAASPSLQAADLSDAPAPRSVDRLFAPTDPIGVVAVFPSSPLIPVIDPNVRVLGDADAPHSKKPLRKPLTDAVRPGA